MPFNVAIAVPSTGGCKTPFAFSMPRLVAYFAQNRVYPEDGEQKMDFLTVEGSGISSNREDLARAALAKPELTHVLWIDDDTSFDMDTLHGMARRRHSIVACNYRMRMPPAEFTALKLDCSGRIQTTAESTGLEEAYYTGFGFCLMERKVLESVSEPRFLVEYGQKTYTTEDMPFFRKAREAGHRCWVDHDASKKIVHWGMLGYRWDKDYSGLVLNEVKP